jgi:hypothetical protein
MAISSNPAKEWCKIDAQPKVRIYYEKVKNNDKIEKVLSKMR